MLRLASMPSLPCGGGCKLQLSDIGDISLDILPAAILREWNRVMLSRAATGYSSRVHGPQFSCLCALTMGVSLQKVAGLSGVLKVALSNKNSGKLGQNSGKQSISLISIGWGAAAADAAGIHLTEGSSHCDYLTVTLFCQSQMQPKMPF